MYSTFSPFIIPYVLLYRIFVIFKSICRFIDEVILFFQCCRHHRITYLPSPSHHRIQKTMANWVLNYTMIDLYETGFGFSNIDLLLCAPLKWFCHVKIMQVHENHTWNIQYLYFRNYKSGKNRKKHS